jgi:hypothetical protein
MTQFTNSTPAVWDPTTGRIYTFLNRDGRSIWGGETLEELQAQGQVSQQAYALPTIEALDLQIESDRQRYCTGPHRISQERYEEALNCLPPERWIRGVGYASFRMSERITGTIATFYVRVGDSFYELNEHEDTSHGELFQACMAFDAPAESAAAICRRAGC